MSATLTIDNTPPIIDSCDIDNTAPYTVDDLSVLVTGSQLTSGDVDGNAVSVSYDWYVEGAVDPGAAAALLPASQTSRGDTVYELDEIFLARSLEGSLRLHFDLLGNWRLVTVANAIEMAKDVRGEGE